MGRTDVAARRGSEPDGSRPGCFSPDGLPRSCGKDEAASSVSKPHLREVGRERSGTHRLTVALWLVFCMSSDRPPMSAATGRRSSQILSTPRRWKPLLSDGGQGSKASVTSAVSCAGGMERTHWMTVSFGRRSESSDWMARVSSALRAATSFTSAAALRSAVVLALLALSRSTDSACLSFLTRASAARRSTSMRPALRRRGASDGSVECESGSEA